MPKLRRMLFVLFIALAAGYAAILVLLFIMQRNMLFPRPEKGREPLFPQANLVTIPPTADTPFEGKALYLKAPEGGRTLVHFHGNGEQLADVTDVTLIAKERGMGFFAPEYPGYGFLSAQQPSQAALFSAAEASLKHLTQVLGVPNDSITLEGQSLGSGIAVEMAARGYGNRLILVSAYTAISDIAADIYWWLPVRALVRDPFNSQARAPNVKQPVLLVHARADDVIPYAQSVELTKHFKTAELFTPNAGHHNDVWDQPDLIDAVFAFANRR